jgi:cell volume regulation protein A
MDTDTITAFLAIGFIIFIGFFGNAIFNKYRIPDILILVLLGMVIGPDILGTRFEFVTNDTLANIDTFRDLFLSAALVIILFDGGLSLDLRTVLQSMKLSALMSVLTFILEMLFIGVILHFILDMDFLLALTLGSIVGGTTEAVVIPLARRMRIHPRTKAMLIMESVITDVLVIVTTITLISLIQIGDFNLVNIATDAALKFTVGGVVGALAGIAWLFVLDRLHNQPLSYMITVAALFVIAGVVELPPVNSSGAVAALTFGLAIGNRQFVKRKLTSLSLASVSDDHIHHFQSEITFFVRTFFFVYLGLMFRFDTFSTKHLVAGLLVISIIVLVRRMTSALTWKVGDLETCDANAVFSMMPKGLSAAVLATLPAASLAGLAIWNDDLGILFLNVTLIVILGTTILATIFSFATERGIDKKQMMELRQRLRETE